MKRDTLNGTAAMKEAKKTKAVKKEPMDVEMKDAEKESTDANSNNEEPKKDADLLTLEGK